MATLHIRRESYSSVSYGCLGRRSSADEDGCIKLAFPTESAPHISSLNKLLLLEGFLKCQIFDISRDIEVKVIFILCLGITLWNFTGYGIKTAPVVNFNTWWMSALWVIPQKKAYWYALPRRHNVFSDTANVSEYIMLNNTQEIFRGENGHNLIKVLFQNLWMD